MIKKLFLSGCLILALLFTQLSVFGYNADIYVVESNFKSGIGLPWHLMTEFPGNADFEIKENQFIVEVRNPGEEQWNIQLRHRGIPIIANAIYDLTFIVEADKTATIYTRIGEVGPPYEDYWNNNWKAHNLEANIPYTFNTSFKFQVSNPSGEWSFHLGNGSFNSVKPNTIFKFSDMKLLVKGASIAPSPTPLPKNLIHVNQVGYLPEGSKKATLVSNSTSTHEWYLKNSSGDTVARGETIVFGADEDSGDFVHIIDFSDYDKSGEGYYIEANGERSYPFDIGMVYSDMKYDALKYFYYNRSASPIEAEYSHNISFVRPAGHENQEGIALSGYGFKGGFTLDIEGGWYNYGLYGKDVNDASMATWVMQNQYERAIKKGTAEEFYGDGKLNIPESGNGIPDLLDEARWSMEFLLKMQVPEGYDREGMVFHKTEIKSTMLGVGPHELEESQIGLRHPATAATLNFAAVSAQSARLWKELDNEFSNRCLKSAEIAWNAAVANPDIFVPNDYNLIGFVGDSYMLDEFYWAACELLITTGKEKYLDYIRNSPHFLKMPSELSGGETLGVVGAFDVSNRAALGTLSLALNAPTQLTATEFSIARANISTACDVWIGYQKNQGYGITIQPRPLKQSDPNFKGYQPQSNLYVLNQCIAFAYAYEYTGDNKYFNAMTEAVDYIMGRNPMSQCYVTGYGSIPLQNPFHQWFANQINPKYPKAPSGWISSGPTSLLDDNWVKGAGMKSGMLPPQKGFIDHIESWSTNEPDITLNSSLAWVTSYLSEGTLPTTPKQPVTFLTGDLNSDGLINSTDVVLMRRLILEIPVEINMYAADMNGDGIITSIDYILLKRQIILPIL